MSSSLNAAVGHLQNVNGRSPTTLLRVAANRRTSNDLPEIKLAVLGTLGVGKSALVVKYITKRFIMEYDPLLEDIYSKTETLDGREMTIKLMDTSDSNTKSPDRYLKWAQGFVVVFSITCRSSFDEAVLYLEMIARYQQETGKELPVGLIGNKSDLERYRTVSKSTAEDLASQFDCVYLETSAAEDLASVVLVFHEIARDIVRSRDALMSMQSLFISEDRSPLLGSSCHSIQDGHAPLGVTKRIGHSKVKDVKEIEKKDDTKLIHRRTTTSFKLFNKSFKIFN